MNEDEYQAFLEHLFDTYIRDRLHRLDRYFDHPKMGHRWNYEHERLRRAMHIIRYIQAHCDSTDDIYSTFRDDRLRRTVDEVRDGVRFNTRLAEESGFLDAIDAYYTEIVEGMNIDCFPESEFDILRELGSENPKREIQANVHILKSRQSKSRSCDQMSVSSQLSHAEETLSSAEKEMKTSDDNDVKEKPKKSRRWFKGLGQIAQGAVLSLADIGLAAGALGFPVSPETKTWGTLVSSTTGVGMILTGVGELRGE